MIYGTPDYTIEDDQTDKVGIRTVILSKMWQPSRPGMSKLEILAAVPEPPEMPGGVSFVGKQTRRISGALRTFWTFMGIDGDGNSVTFKERHNTEDYGFQPGFSQASIIVHPDFPRLRDTYGGIVIDGEVQWPPQLGDDSGADFRGLGRGGYTTEQKNPLYGVQDFLRMEGTYRCRYVARDLKVLAQMQAGTIRLSGSLPGAAPSFSGRDWLVAPPAYARRGPVYEIEENYWLSGRGGWPKPIYGTGSQR